MTLKDKISSLKCLGYTVETGPLYCIISSQEKDIYITDVNKNSTEAFDRCLEELKTKWDWLESRQYESYCYFLDKSHDKYRDYMEKKSREEAYKREIYNKLQNNKFKYKRR